MKKHLLLIITTFIAVTLQAQNVGIDNTNPKQKLDVSGAIKIGNTTADETGSIRFNGTNFQGYDGATWKNLDATGGSGTVTSVDISLPSIFSVTSSPVTTAGTLTAALASQTQNLVFASPNGASGTPTFRALVANDIPNLDMGKITTGNLAWSRLTGVPSTFAPSAGSGNYIQNTATQQAGASFNIENNGTIGGTLNVASTTTTRGILTTAVATTGYNLINRTGGGANYFPFTDGNNYISSDLTKIRTAANATIADFTGTGVTIPVGLTVTSGLTASNGTTLNGGVTVNNVLTSNGVTPIIVNRPASGNCNIEYRTTDGSMWAGADGVANFAIGTTQNLNVSHILVAKRSNSYVGIGINSPTYRLELPTTNTVAGRGYANQWVASSSIRFKENVRTINNSMDIIKKLEGKYYDYKVEYGGGKGIGFIAEEVMKILPELAEPDPENNNFSKGIAYDEFIPILTQAIKEQQEIIEKLQGENNIVNSKLNIMQTELHEIKELLKDQQFKAVK